MPILDNHVYAHLRLCVQSAASLLVREGRSGIQCVGFPSAKGNPALVVVWDDDSGNEGASATNSIETVLRYLRERWAGVIPVETALIIERDSTGAFDHAYPDWCTVRNQGARTPNVGWQPLHWPGAKPRSVDAFHSLFGVRAQVTLDIIKNGPCLPL